MELHLTNCSPINTSFTVNDGRTLYHVETPFSFGTRTTTIHKVVQDDSFTEKGEKESLLTLEESIDTAVADQELLHDDSRQRRVAEIEWRNFGCNKLRFGGVEHPSNSFLKPTGMCSQHRVFIGPDQRQYKWNTGGCGMMPPILEVSEIDGSWKCIAKYHKRHLGVLSKARKGYLEILPEAQHLADIIVITFVYCDHIRMKKKMAAQMTVGVPMVAAHDLVRHRD